LITAVSGSDFGVGWTLVAGSTVAVVFTGCLYIRSELLGKLVFALAPRMGWGRVVGGRAW